TTTWPTTSTSPSPAPPNNASPPTPASPPTTHTNNNPRTAHTSIISPRSTPKPGSSVPHHLNHPHRERDLPRPVAEAKGQRTAHQHDPGDQRAPPAPTAHEHAPAPEPTGPRTTS